MGRDKVQVAQILKDHNVLVRGGPEQGSKLMEALVVSPHAGVNAADCTNRLAHTS